MTHVRYLIYDDHTRVVNIETEFQGLGWTAAEPNWEPGFPIARGRTEKEAIDSLVTLIDSTEA